MINWGTKVLIKEGPWTGESGFVTDVDEDEYLVEFLRLNELDYINHGMIEKIHDNPLEYVGIMREKFMQEAENAKV